MAAANPNPKTRLILSPPPYAIATIYRVKLYSLKAMPPATTISPWPQNPRDKLHILPWFDADVKKYSRANLPEIVRLAPIIL
jgi:hypothetical protein